MSFICWLKHTSWVEWSLIQIDWNVPTGWKNLVEQIFLDFFEIQWVILSRWLEMMISQLNGRSSLIYVHSSVIAVKVICSFVITFFLNDLWTLFTLVFILLCQSYFELSPFLRIFLFFCNVFLDFFLTIQTLITPRKGVLHMRHHIRILLKCFMTKSTGDNLYFVIENNCFNRYFQLYVIQL